MKIAIPEFRGSVQPEEFLDWLVAVEEVLDFKEVPENNRVSLVATRFRGRAAAWWQQIKLTRTRQGKSKIDSWEKMKKHMRMAFLPHNYTRMMYQQLLNLRQGTKTIDEYTTEFYQLVSRNDLTENEDQLVSRYFGGLQEQYQDTLNLFDPYSISEAHQRAIQLEKMSKRRSGVTGWPSGNTSGNRNLPPTNRNTSTNLPGARWAPPQIDTAGKPPGGQSNRNPGTSGGMRCFKCGEVGHRAADCRKSDRIGKGLFIDSEEIVEDGTNEVLQDTTNDSEVSIYDKEERVAGDEGPLLVVRRACYTPQEVEGNGWLRNNIFQSTCTISGKVCKFVIDYGRCENVSAEDVVA